MYVRTLREAAGPAPYDVGLPDAGLGWEKVGPLFERYCVKLVGRVDPHWAETYERLVADAPNLRRFRLDANQPCVTFTCRSTDGPVEVMAVLKILEKLVEQVNREASLAAARLPEDDETSLAEAADRPSGGPGLRSIFESFARTAASK